MEIKYSGEHLLPGYIGNFFIFLAFVSSLLSIISFYKTRKEQKSGKLTVINSWYKFSYFSFQIHSISILSIIAILFYLLFNHCFEYYYVWQHSSKELPFKYILSAFWEGQEGSFLLWMFWNIFLSQIILLKKNKWTAPVLTIISLVQFFLNSMLLGIYVFDYKIGSNPFILLRNYPDFSNLPFINNPDYLKFIKGRGLNPLLQNYWMTIHPPTLFLGFASTLIPFAYAIASLWMSDIKKWANIVLKWQIFSILILGAGILMGGAWAYEALSFGGFWAWDPVENSSLVPWLLMIAAMHLTLIVKARKKNYRIAFIFTFLPFITTLYSTFLTRSGILGDASVHAFTDMGMSGQLIIYLLFFVLLSLIVFLKNNKIIPKSKEEDLLSSKEFWLFSGALILLISSFQLTFTTSIPVLNKIFNTKLAPPVNIKEHYNSWQIPFAIILSLLMGFSQFLDYKKSNIKKVIKKLLLSIIFASFLSIIIVFSLKIRPLFHIILLFSSLFAFISNIDYLIKMIKYKVSSASSSMAHTGFALILLGVLISQSKQKIISQNTSQYDISILGNNFNNKENIMLNLGDTLKMDNYYIVYSGKEKEGVNIYYNIKYFKKSKNGDIKYAFTLKPRIQLNKTMGNVAEPDTKHFIDKDIYTHITYADLSNEDEFSDSKIYYLSIGDTLYLNRNAIILKGIEKNINKNDLSIGANISIINYNGIKYNLIPVLLIKNNTIIDTPIVNDTTGIKISFKNIDTDNNKFVFEISEKKVKNDSNDFIIMKAIVFPFINILWVGAIIMFIGCALSIYYKLKF